jgi:hypothetical protein
MDFHRSIGHNRARRIDNRTGDGPGISGGLSGCINAAPKKDCCDGREERQLGKCLHEFLPKSAREKIGLKGPHL